MSLVSIDRKKTLSTGVIIYMKGDTMTGQFHRTALLLIAAFFIATSGTAYAQCPKNEGKDGIPMQDDMAPAHMMIPDLTDAQKDAMETLRLDHMKAVQPLHNEIAEKQARLRTLQTADKVNMVEVNRVIEDVGALHTRIMKLKAAHHQEIRSLLTDEQRVFFDAHGPRHQGPHGKDFPKRNDPR